MKKFATIATISGTLFVLNACSDEYSDIGRTQESVQTSEKHLAKSEKPAEEKNTELTNIKLSLDLKPDDGEVSLYLVEEEKLDVSIEDFYLNLRAIKLKDSVVTDGDEAEDEARIASQYKEMDKIEGGEVEKFDKEKAQKKEKHGRREFLREKKKELVRTFKQLDDAAVKVAMDRRESGLFFLRDTLFSLKDGKGYSISVDSLNKSYQRIELKVKPLWETDKEEMLGHSYYLKAKVGDKEVIIADHTALNIRLEFAEAAKLSDLVLGLNLEAGLKRLDLSRAEVAEDGKIYIDGATNRDLLRQFRLTLRQKIRGGKDTDKDGKISSKSDVLAMDKNAEEGNQID